MKKIKLISLILALVMVLGLFAACGSEGGSTTTEAKTTDDGNTTTVDNTNYAYGTVHGIEWTWGGQADKADATAVQREEERNAMYLVQTGNTRECVAFKYNYDTVGALFEGGGMPTAFSVSATEPVRLVANGWGRDISACVEAVGIDLSLFNQAILETYKDENGGIYGLPNSAYSMCLVVNLAKYREAGLVDDNGAPIQPKTWDELIEQAETIYDATGAGIALQCVDNQGGWFFTNIGWNFGADFCVLNEETGKYESGIYSDATIAALEWWKKACNSRALVGSPSVDNRSANQNMLKSGEAAIILGATDFAPNMTRNDMDGMAATDIAYMNMPAGPDGLSYNLMGGSGYWFAEDATDEQVIAVLEYLMHYGDFEVEWSDDAKATDEKTWTDNRAKDQVQLPGFPVFTSEKYDQQFERRNEIAGANGELYSYDAQFKSVFDYVQTEGSMHTEEECDTQNLYAQLSAILQEISTNPDADCDALAKTAHENYSDLLITAQG